MKKILKLLLIIFLVSINISYLKADCESDKEAVKSLNIDNENYVRDGKFIAGFQITSDQPADLYAEVTEESDTNKVIVEMKNGYMDYLTEYDNEPTQLNVKLYSKSCQKEVLDEFVVEASTLNPFSGLEVCSKVAGASQLCSKYADVSDMTEEEFSKSVKKDINSIMLKINIKNGIRKYLYLALIPFFTIGIGYIIAIRMLKEKRKSVYRGGGIKWKT